MRIATLFVAGFLWIACNDVQKSDAEGRKDGFSQTPKTKEDSLYHEVMEGHDVGMAKMGQLKGALKQVQQALDSVHKLPAAKQNKQYLQVLTSVQEDLNYAETSMNKWMEDFSIDSGKGNPEVRIPYLESERNIVNKVKENILNSLNRADSLLKK